MGSLPACFCGCASTPKKRPYGLGAAISTARLTYISQCLQDDTIRRSSERLTRAFAGTPVYLSSTWTIRTLTAYRSPHTPNWTLP
jgi:hypothetical protein